MQSAILLKSFIITIWKTISGIQFQNIPYQSFETVCCDSIVELLCSTSDSGGYITLHYVTLHYIALRFMTSQHVALRHVTLYCIALHYVTLHYISIAISQSQVTKAETSVFTYGRVLKGRVGVNIPRCHRCGTSLNCHMMMMIITPGNE